MINHAEKIDCRAFVSEKYFRHFSKKTFSAESVLTYSVAGPLSGPAKQAAQDPVERGASRQRP